MKYIILVLVILTNSSCSKKLAVVKLNNKYGCIDKSGNFIIQPDWDYILIGHKRKDLILVTKDSLYGFIDRKGNIVISPQYKDADLFSEGLTAVSNGTKYGFINTNGNTIIPFIYDDIFWQFSKGLCDVEINDSCGYINKDGEVVIALAYDNCYPFINKYATVLPFEGNYILIDKKGNIYDYDKLGEKVKTFPPKHAYPGFFQTNTGQGRVNSKGDTIVPPKYLVTGNLSNGMYIVKDKKGKWGAYNKKGKLAVPLIYEHINHFHEGLAIVTIKGKDGMINKNGQIVVQPIFDKLGTFHKGLAYAETNGKAGFINKKGIFEIAPKFELSNLASWHFE